MTWQQAATFRGADRKAREIVVADLIEPRHLGGFAADEGATRLLAAGCNPGHHRRADLRCELAAGEIVEEEQWLGTLDHKIIYRHGDEIDADGVMPSGFNSDLDLGTDAVRGGHQPWIAETRALQVEQSTKSANCLVGAGAGSGAHQWLDEVHHAIACVDINARLRIGKAIVAL